MSTVAESPIVRLLVSPAYATLITVLVGWASTLYFARTVARLPVGRVAAGMFLLAISALAGARLHFLLANGLGVARERLTDTSAHVGGGIVGLLVGLPLVSRALRLPLATMADVSAMATGVAIATYRIGCQLRGCCIGIPTDAPWGVRYGRDSVAFVLHSNSRLVPADSQWSAPVHPLPLYFAAAALAITIVGRALYPQRRYDGQIALLSLTLFSLSTVGLEFLRADIPGQVRWGPLPQLIWMAAALSVTSLALLALFEVRSRREPA